jgi:hypothetical protein
VTAAARPCSFTQILETAAEFGFQGEEWTTLACDTRTLARGLRTVERIEAWRYGLRARSGGSARGREHPGNAAVRGRSGAIRSGEFRH